MLNNPGKTKQSPLATRTWVCIIYWLLCSMSSLLGPLPLSLPPLGLPTLPSPHSYPDSSLFCTAIQLTQAPTCRLTGPCTCPAELKELPLKRNPLLCWWMADTLSSSIARKSMNLIENLLCTRYSYSRNWTYGRGQISP